MTRPTDAQGSATGGCDDATPGGRSPAEVRLEELILEYVRFVAHGIDDRVRKVVGDTAPDIAIASADTDLETPALPDRTG